MVHSLDGDDFLAQVLRVRVQVLDEFGFGVCRADDQDFFRIAQRLGDLREERRIFRSVARGLRPALVVEVPVRFTVHELRLDVLAGEMQDVGFGVV